MTIYGEKTFPYPLCDFACSQKCNLSNHMNVHSEKNPFVCKYGTIHSMGIKVPTQIKMHIRSHTGDKPYICAFCTYSEVNKSNLNPL